MKTRGWVAAIALVVAVNAFVLARVAANRRGEADATLILTEAELPLVNVAPSSESSGVSLRLDVHHFLPWSPDRDLDPMAWLDAEKLGSLGFRVALPSDGAEAELFVQRQLPREAFAVLELGGPAWERHRRRLEERYSLSTRPVSGAESGAERAFAQRELRFGSRLFVVDVGKDAADLRRRYPDRSAYLVAPAEVRMFLDGNCRTSRCQVRGSVSLLIPEVNVPRRLQGKLPAARAEDPNDWSVDHPPRYEVVLASGRRHEPWIEDIRPIANARR